jgi:hypothetical protein
MSKEDKALARRTIEILWNQGYLAVAEERFASDYVGHTPTRLKGRRV